MYNLSPVTSWACLLGRNENCAISNMIRYFFLIEHFVTFKLLLILSFL